MIVLNTRYDLQTVLPWAVDVARQHGQPLIEFADAQHGLTASGTGGKFPDGSSCARALMLGFAENPSAPLKDSCVAELPQIDVNLQRDDLRQAAMSVFGTEDAWSLLPVR